MLEIHKSAAVGRSYLPNVAFVSGRQTGKRHMHRAWLQYLWQPLGEQPRLMARAVRFALEHWHA